MPPKKIRIAVSGLGRIGWDFHCAQIAKHPQFEFVAVQDVDPERLREAKQVYGVAGYRDFSEMLAECKLEVAVIATPTHLHKTMAIEALRAGCHVLLEKPMARDSAEAAAIVRAASRHQRLLTVYQPLRAVAYFQHLRRLLSSGMIGEPYHVRVGSFNYVQRNDWQSLRRFGGGMLNNYGAHALDQVLQIIGYDIRSVFANLRVVASLGDADDVVKVVLESRKGFVGEIDINQASTIQPYAMQVWGTRGAVVIPRDRDQLIVSYFRPEDIPSKSLNKALASEGRQYPFDKIPIREEAIPVDGALAVDFYANLADAVRKGRPLFVKPEEPLAVMRLIDRCRESGGRIVKTPLIQRKAR
jgi:predicted dehydrogenase